ncbi:hypothetical protein CDL12_03729 [Handroanthus impetiginosus]|uniref:Putative plant transposon protein domain-containing protein n=1 Tax=Handroanthus impetiginosus TaxID=429701 RepID=A0A2G9I1C3_9LAMI|nr:hypothetical protein CDL12_03729 [Handroanthus impetiginosus]
MVRGKNINFSARTINSLFGTPSIDTPEEVQEFLEDHLPLDTIRELIYRDDPQWTLSRLNEPIHLSRTKLTFVADNWLRFVSARLLPSSHTSEVMRECAVMIYAILTDVPFDIGRFLHRSILKSAMGGLTIGLYHPSLIIELCARVGLERQPGDELLQLDSMIRADRRPPRPAGAPVHPRQRQPPPALGLEEQVDRLADEVHQLQLQQEQQFSYQQYRPHYPPDEPVEPPPPPPNMGDE